MSFKKLLQPTALKSTLMVLFAVMAFSPAVAMAGPSVTASATQTLVPYGGTTYVQWSSSGTSQTAGTYPCYMANVGWVSYAGTMMTDPIVSYANRAIYCVNADGQSNTVPIDIYPAVDATASASPNPVSYAGNTTFTWSSHGATSCVVNDAYGGGLGVVGTSGSWSVGPIMSYAGRYVTCTNQGAPWAVPPADSNMVNIYPIPTATLSASPTSVAPGGISTISWSSHGATGWNGYDYYGSGTTPFYGIIASQGQAALANGSGSTHQLYSDTTYMFQPVNAGAAGTPQYVTVCISPRAWDGSSCVTSAVAPTASLSVSPTSVAYGGQASLSWSSTDATSCTAGGPWTNQGTLSGSGWTDPLTTNTTFSFQCTGSGGTTSTQYATVTVGAAASCTLPWGGSIASGQTATAYQASSVVAPAACVSETRTCANGTLSGSYTNQGCAVTYAVPTATLSVSPNPVAYNGQSTLTWSSTGATSCTAGGPWSNQGTLSGSGLTNPLTADTTFTFQCTGPGGTSPLQSVTVAVSATSCSNGANNPPSCNQCTSGNAYIGSSCVACSNGGCTGAGAGGSAATPLGSLVCINGATNPQNCSVFIPTATLSVSPSTINVGQSSTLTWSSTNATSCTAVGGFSTGGATSNNTGVTTGPLSQTSSYQMSCTGAGGISAPANATVTVVPPSVSITANPLRVQSGRTSTISWVATGVTSCAESGPGLSSATKTGSQVITISSQSTFTIICQTVGSPIPQTATVNVVPTFQEF